MHIRPHRPPVAAVFALVLLAAPALAAPPTFRLTWPIFARGERGADVRAIQLLLLARGYPLPADGVFGGATASALRRFQRAHRLRPSGETNDPTWESLIVPVHQGSRGPAVRAAQVELRNDGYPVALDGVFGPRMAAAVRKLQARTGRAADGVVGRDTWYELVGGAASDANND